MQRLLAPPPQLTRERLAAQMLSGPPARSPAEVAGRLLAVQGQDPRGARLAIRARSSALTAADVDRALTIDRSLVITWLNRGTLHLVRADDYFWLHKITALPQFQVGCRRILARYEVSDYQAEMGVAVVEAALAAEGPLTKAQLARRITAAGLPPTAGVALHVLMLASLRGIAVRGPMIGAQQGYVLVRDWLGEPPPDPGRDAALGWLARRYLAGHGPAGDRDLAKWAGLPVGQARRGLAAIAGELRERPDGLIELAGRAPASPVPPAPRLLGAYDPLLLGWASRAPVLGEHQEIVSVNGLFKPFALVNGRAAGVWRWQRGSVALDMFGGMPDHVQSALDAEARDIQRFLADGAADETSPGDLA